MNTKPERVSHDNLADLLDSAIQLETQRIESLNAALIDQVSGGLSSLATGSQVVVSLPGTLGGGATLGIIAPPPPTETSVLS